MSITYKNYLWQDLQNMLKLNYVIVSNKTNRIKTDATVDEIRKVGDFYEKLLKVK